MSRRLTRLNEQIRREVAEIVRWEVADPRVGAATVTGVEVAPDLTTARVFVALAGPPEERRESLAGLDAAAPFVRSQLADRLDLRRTPALRFLADDSLAQASRIERLLSEVEPTGGWEAASEAEEAAPPAGGEREPRTGPRDLDSPIGP